MLKALTNFEIHQNLFTLLHFVMDDPVLLLLQDIIKVDWCRKECGVVWPVQLCQTATMAGIYKFCPKIMRFFPSQTSQIWFSTPFKVIFWSETVKTNVSTKLRDSNIHTLIYLSNMPHDFWTKFRDSNHSAAVTKVQGEPSNDYHKRKLCSMQIFASAPRQMLIN